MVPPAPSKAWILLRISPTLSLLYYPAVLPCLQSWLKDASNTFKGIDGPFSAGYAALTAGLLGAGIGYIVAPGLTLGGVSHD
jgi:hypothetical protein